MRPEDRLLEGAFDSHAHGYPEFTLDMPPRVDNLEWARLAAAAGMRGFVVKSHIWPTTTAASLMRTLEPSLEIYGSITCNPPAGGLDATAVEIAARCGARVVWMPTWSAGGDGTRSNIYLDRMRTRITTLDDEEAVAARGLDVLGDDGALVTAARRIIDVCRRYDLTLASGHLPIASSLALAEEAEARGVRFVLTHPLSGSVGASIEQQRAVVAHGGMIEHVFVGCLPMHQRMDPHRIATAIEAVGAEHCIMASDAIEAWNPPAPEVLRMFIATMLALGFDAGAVRAMTHENPARALGLEQRRPPGLAADEVDDER